MIKWIKDSYLIIQIRWLLFLIRKSRNKEKRLMSQYLRKIHGK
jgi:hypothetical protein